MQNNQDIVTIFFTFNHYGHIFATWSHSASLRGEERRNKREIN